MKMVALCQAMACVALLPVQASAADLDKIDRAITKEPAYQTKMPKYCLLVFGPEAKHRIWLVLDGNTLYVDKNGNGDLTDEGERIKAPVFKASTHPAYAQQRSITVGDLSIGGLTHTDLEVSQTQYRRRGEVANGADASVREMWQRYLDSIWRQVPDGIVYSVSIKLDPRCYGLFGDTKGGHVWHFAWIDRHGHLAFADRPKDAPVVHFGGPLTLRHRPTEELRRGKDPTEVALYLGTPGLGPGAFATMNYDLVPKDIYPTVAVRFPAKEPGHEPVTRIYVLKEHC